MNAQPHRRGLHENANRLVGPTLVAWGTREQKQRYLPALLRSEHMWCQGFSEPNAGSDLASLRTTAVLDGDHFVVNGQKIWTTHAHYADFCALMTRTDPDARPHEGMKARLTAFEATNYNQIVGQYVAPRVFLTLLVSFARERYSQEERP